MKTFINNRDGNKVCVVVENEGQDKLAFVMHGLGGFKEQAHIRAMVEAFLENSYTVATWDAVHTFGESEGGSYEDATVTNYCADLEDVINWANTQTWYKEPFVLCGHSLGGLSTALYAENHPQKVRAVAPISPVVSGKLSLETKSQEELDKWMSDGIQVSMSSDGKREKRLKWSHMEDRQKYDLLPSANKLTMPVFSVVGSMDTTTPAKHIQIFIDAVPAVQKEMRLIDGASHSFNQSHEQKELKELLKNWLKTV